MGGLVFGIFPIVAVRRFSFAFAFSLFFPYLFILKGQTRGLGVRVGEAQLPVTARLGIVVPLYENTHVGARRK
jgi:hypothetical protein